MKPAPDHLFISECDGHLYDTRVPGWHKLPPLCPDYSGTRSTIRTVADLKATLRAGAYTWPGGYPLYFITDDGAALSFESVRENFRSVVDSVRHGHRDGWRVIGCEINYEDPDLICSHSGEPIESAYGDA